MVDKPYYNSKIRELIDRWEDNFHSKKGYLEGETLYVPDSWKKGIDLNNTKLIIIQDIKYIAPKFLATNWKNMVLPEEPIYDTKNHMHLLDYEFFSFKDLSYVRSFEIFKIQKTEREQYNLHLDYARHGFFIGHPKREDHKICELKVNQPIRYMINGKSDFTYSGRSQRTYIMHDYIMEYLGQAKNVESKKMNDMIKMKRIPLDSCKVIDERKSVN